MWCIPAETAVTFHEESGYFWVLRVGDDAVRGMSTPAYAIWQAADGASSLDDVVRRLVDELNVDGDAVRADTEIFVDNLLAVGLLEEVHDGAV